MVTGALAGPNTLAGRVASDGAATNCIVLRKRAIGVANSFAEEKIFIAATLSHSCPCLSCTRENPTPIGETVEITKNLGVRILQSRDLPFRSAAGRSRKIESRGNALGAGNDPILRIERFIFFKVDNHCGNPIDHFSVSYVEAVLRISFSIFRQSSEFSHDVDQIFLDGENLLSHKFVIGNGAGESERGGQFIHRTVSFNARIVLWHSPAVHERRFALVT